MIRSINTLLALVILTPCSAQSQASSVILEVHTGGERLVLSESQIDRISQSIAEIASTCAINSSRLPQADWWPKDLAADWTNIRAGSHVYVKFSTSIQNDSRWGTIPIEEVVIDIEETTRTLGWLRTRHEGKVVAYIKCSGHELVKLECADPFRSYLPSGGVEHCKRLEKQGFD